MASGVTRTGKPCQAGDQVSITGTIVSVTGSGPSAVLVILCSGALMPADNSVSALPYTYTLTATTPSSGTPPTGGVYAADVTASQSL
jgi:hypothetical protein